MSVETQLGADGQVWTFRKADDGSLAGNSLAGMVDMEWTRTVALGDDNTPEQWRIILDDRSVQNQFTYLLRRWSVEPYRLIQVYTQRYGSIDRAQEGAAIAEEIAKVTPSPGRTVD